MSQPAGRIANPIFLLPSVAFLLIALAATPAFAASKQASKQAQERNARKACLGGDYNRGVNILADLFVSTKDPTYIFNQGRCFEQNHRYEDAISRFEEYLRVPDANLSTEDRASAEKHIADCKEKLPEQPAKFAPQVFVPPTPVTAPEPKPTPSTPVVVEPERQPAPVSSGAGLRIGGIVTASVGVAAVAAGVVFNLMSNSLINDMETNAGSYTKSKDTNSKNYKTFAWVGYGVGAACIVTGAILYGVGYRPSESSSTSVAILPAFGPGQAGALLTGGF